VEPVDPKVSLEFYGTAGPTISHHWFPRLAYQVVQCEALKQYVQYEAEYWNRPYW
jgi:hypothetical protein